MAAITTEPGDPGFHDRSANHHVEALRGRSGTLGAYPDRKAVTSALREVAARWASVFDPNSMIALAKARAHFNTKEDFGRLRPKVLYVLSRTDELFPPSIAPEVMAKLRPAGVMPPISRSIATRAIANSPDPPAAVSALEPQL
jgi:homoserine acetyltransferase